MTSPIFRIALSGLNAAQAGIATTTHNIANASTPGYSRQEVLLTSQLPAFTGGTYFGRGVSVEGVLRRYDQYLDADVGRAQSAASHFEALQAQAASVDNLLGDPQMGLGPAMAEFFAGLNAVAAQPGDAASRQALLSSGESLAARFRLLGEAIDTREHAIDQRLEAATGSINTLTTQLARLNERIVQAGGVGQPPNDLLDQRDQLIRDLGKLVPVSTVEQSNGALNAYLAGGQPLVVNDRAYRLGAMTDPFDPSRRTFGLDTGAGIVELSTAQLSGGEVGGMLAARREVLDPAQDALGRIAMTLADAFNAQHRLGVDRTGAAGGDFFTVASPAIAAASTNTGTAQLQATLSSSAALTGLDYDIVYTGVGYTATLSDGTTRTFTSLPVTLDGVQLTLASGTPNAGDRFQLRPTRDGASALAMALTDPAKIAAAAPIRTAATGANTGTGTISAGVVGSLDPNLAQPVTITFTAAGTFDVAGTGTGNPTGLAFTPGMTLAYNGWSVTLDGAPKAGDTFTVGPNTAGTGDNRNARLLAGLQSTRLVGNGAFSLSDAYGALVADVGNATHAAGIASKAQASMLAEARQSAEAVSGVNLDEEAANLLRQQQAYQAAAKVMQVADSLFDTLLQLGR